MEHFTPIASTIGGVLIGLSAVILLAVNGRIAGISGVAGSLFSPKGGDVAWRVAFVFGLAAAGLAMFPFLPDLFAVEIDRTSWSIAAAGLLVGFGTRLGSGCTSGHGVCGLARLSTRSLAAVLLFMAAGALVVFVVRVFFGGAV